MIRIFTVEKKNDVWHAEDVHGTFFSKYGSYDSAIKSIGYDYYIHSDALISEKLGVLAVEPHKEVLFNGWNMVDIEDAAFDMHMPMTEEQICDARQWLERRFDPSKGTRMADIEKAVKMFSKTEKEA